MDVRKIEEKITMIRKQIDETSDEEEKEKLEKKEHKLLVKRSKMKRRNIINMCYLS